MPNIQAGIDYDALARAVLQNMLAVTGKAVSTTPDASYGHGPYGLFSAPGVNPDVFNAMQLPMAGLEARLPIHPTDLATPIYTIVTGQTASSGSEPSTACADWPEAGVLKLCGYQTALDRKGRSSRVFQVDRIGQRRDRADMMDYQLIGDPLKGNFNDANAPTGFGGDGSAALNYEFAKAMREVLGAFVRDFARDVYTGNPVNNSGEGRKFYKGLQLLVNTGYADYETLTACPAADSLVVDWGGIDIAASAQKFVLSITQYVRMMQVIADETNMNPVDWAFVMPRSMFWIITEIWPCAYYTSRCPVPAGATAFVTAEDQVKLRDDMRDQKYLLVDGVKYPVIEDTALPVTALTGGNTGTYTASLYFLPLKVRGGVESLYKEYFDFNAPGAAMSFLKSMGGNLGQFFNTSNNGRFLWLFQPPSSYCVQIEGMARETLVLRTPYLAFRVDNVAWTPIALERSAFPGDPTYVNGGKTTRPNP